MGAQPRLLMKLHDSLKQRRGISASVQIAKMAELICPSWIFVPFTPSFNLVSLTAKIESVRDRHKLACEIWVSVDEILPQLFRVEHDCGCTGAHRCLELFQSSI